MKRATYITIYGLAIAFAAVLLLSAYKLPATPTPAKVASWTARPTPSETSGQLAHADVTTATVPAPVATATTPDEGIHWYAWEPATFTLAQAENKPILLDLTAVWCHWCHVMDKTTYSDPTVISLVNALYIPIRVDTDQRPDVQARYLLGGWPTTAFLTPQGDILTGYTYVPPEELIPLLRQISDYYAANEADIAARVAELRQQQAARTPT